MDRSFEREVSGLYEDVGSIDVDGPDAANIALERALKSRNAHELLRTLARMRPIENKRKMPHAIALMLRRIARISAGLAAHTGKLEADYLRRPNQLCAVITTVLAPGASVAFSVQPASGQSYYRFLGMAVSDTQADQFGFTSLKVGGLEHVNYNQTAPVSASIVTNGVPWNGEMIRESSYISHLAPWTGQVFDNQTPIYGNIANLTVAGSGDAFTGAARMQFLIQSDPCGKRYNASIESSEHFYSNWSKQMGHYAEGFRGREAHMGRI